MSADHEPQEEFARVEELQIDQIRPNPKNPRLVFPEDELDRLAQSIAQEGILVPIVVYEEDDLFTLIDGERRYKCALQLGFSLASIKFLLSSPDVRMTSPTWLYAVDGAGAVI